MAKALQLKNIIDIYLRYYRDPTIIVSNDCKRYYTFYWLDSHPIQVWNVDTSSLLFELEFDPNYELLNVSLDPEEKYLIATARENNVTTTMQTKIFIWDLTINTLVNQLNSYNHYINFSNIREYVYGAIEGMPVLYKFTGIAMIPVFDFWGGVDDPGFNSDSFFWSLKMVLLSLGREFGNQL